MEFFQQIEWSEYLKSILFYDKESPLIFTRFFFWGFFAVVLAGYSFVYNNRNRSLRAGYLFLASLFFYYKSSGFFFFILLFSTLTDYFIGKSIYSSRNQTVRKLLLALSVFLNLGLLAYFKYAYFFTESLNTLLGADMQVVNYLAVWANEATGTHFNVNQILLPVGISFFTFQTISYSVDVYRGDTQPVKNLIDFGFYVSFFPQLVAGPIVRASGFVKQIYEDYRVSKRDFGWAVYIILKGLVKKIFIGDYIAVNFVDRVFSDPISYSGFENLMALFGYSLQVYVDFSGYTDIAIGVALLMGFRLPQNFNSPYKAKNVGEFWKRWHISLSSWLKDYLYIPIGGNRNGSFFSYFSLGIILAIVVLLAGKLILIPIFAGIVLLFAILARIFPKVKRQIDTNINLMLTMLLGGLWHGASWQFIIWGGLNGVGLVVYKFWRKISPWETKTNWLATFWKITITFCFITFTRIFFRSESMEVVNGMMHQIGTNLDLSIVPEVLVAYKWVFLVMLFGFFTHWVSQKWKDRLKDAFIAAPLWLKIVISAIVVIIVYQSVSADMQPFIYFQF
ncbi:D-alanyl-lipoteichoic acid acyltransferase DltB, MBOAT superfamily [Tangfeifania diversioriginum]|uniref:D-alanyl-lipoteichoic acid acyltransferase DltB, MBOAT superfamily n=1 Tax=Tangfeifania diversioriginum TaxID=1168035 RepID=A0A1M6E601_9BACT|nr:MBOAT family O-acyltransferase [Tangfeifania diversioriginum]SHI80936.1 D-alanyl-lipoteichoic acid acyltransferase DltB, MBOAT superfamily [Tangfeifania diversioriginum]